MKKDEILEKAMNLKDDIIKDRRYLHSHAEAGFEIGNTVEYVKKSLEEMGYEPKRCGRAGLVATIGGNKPGKVFMLRADMDALPMREESDV